MSFQGQAQATALPAEIQLAKEKPQGAFCLRSRYALSANSANSWLAGSLVSLPLQTGTPATFTDVKQGNINCTVQISNTNPYVDFINFGPCGAIIFFDEMRVYSSGTPVEENLKYSETVDLLMEQGGWQCEPYHVYRRNKWRANNGRAGDKHINFIKPSMVDVSGTPMFGRSPFMDKNSAVYQPSSVAFGYLYDADGGDNTPQNDLALKTASKANAAAVYSIGSVVGLDAGYTFNDDGISDFLAEDVLAASLYKSTTKGRGLNDNLIAGRNSSVVKLDTAVANVHYTTNLGAWKNTQAGRTSSDGADWASHYYLPVASFVPSQWPDFQPCTLTGEVDDYEVDSITGKTKIIEYMKYLANVRSLPVGVPGNSPQYNGSYVSNVDPLTASTAPGVNSPNTRFVEYRVSMPFVSGIYGILADKMFPDLLIGANNIRIEFKLAQNQKALWLTMDPCRRVPGTIRDVVPFTGEAQGGVRGGRIATASAWCASNDAVSATLENRQATALGCFYSRVCPYDSTADANYGGVIRYTISDGSAAQTGAVITDSFYKIVRDSNMYNTASAMGEDLVIPQGHTNLVEGVTDSNGKLFGGHFSAFSSLPKPQYIPQINPWEKKSFFKTVNGVITPVTSTFCNENQSCYGTYLPASVPQTRRCSASSRLAINDPLFQASGTTAFAIRDLQYIGEQVQLDDISASSIIQLAATSEIVVWTRGYRGFQQDCSVGEQQNIILPIQIGQATALYLVFRPGSQILNTDYYSNSFSCPFTGLSFDGARIGADPNSPGIYYGRGGRAADVGGIYTIQSSLDTQNNGLFSYQLFSGTRQYPLQPIQTVSELLVEREKSTHSLHNWAWSGTENMALQSWGKSYNSSTSTGLSFDPFLDLGYFTTFVPTLALDDQTITQNPYFSIAETDETGANRVRIRGIRQSPAISNTQSQFIGVMNRFVPPIGTFFLGWDFESWTNHEDLMRTGKFLGQEQLSVRMTGCYLMSATNPVSAYASPLAQPIQCLAIVPHVVKLSFVPGGHMLSYY
jgi:hypothetical protein